MDVRKDRDLALIGKRMRLQAYCGKERGEWVQMQADVQDEWQEVEMVPIDEGEAVNLLQWRRGRSTMGEERRETKNYDRIPRVWGMQHMLNIMNLI